MPGRLRISSVHRSVPSVQGHRSSILKQPANGSGWAEILNPSSVLMDVVRQIAVVVCDGRQRKAEMLVSRCHLGWTVTLSVMDKVVVSKDKPVACREGSGKYTFKLRKAKVKYGACAERVLWQLIRVSFPSLLTSFLFPLWPSLSLLSSLPWGLFLSFLFFLSVNAVVSLVPRRRHQQEPALHSFSKFRLLQASRSPSTHLAGSICIPYTLFCDAWIICPTALRSSVLAALPRIRVCVPSRWPQESFDGDPSPCTGPVGRTHVLHNHRHGTSVRPNHLPHISCPDSREL